MYKLKTLSVAVVALLSGVSIFGGYATSSAQNATQSDDKLVDIKADLVYPYKIDDTTSVLCMVGQFAAQHNGAVITADSAVRYGDDRLECFGNVLINKNTTYAYADRAEYDGARNIASLYAPLVKVVDEDVVMYTYNFTFNTLTNVGRYWGGGVTTKEADMMESQRGYYYADDRRVVGVDEVELQGEGYLLTGDSVIYEMDGERAYFFDNTNIWNEEDYINGDRGLYDKGADLYSVSRNGYLLTKEQEVWSDSMEYYKSREEAILRHNIQIDDSTNKVLAFGDYAQYWGDAERILLTRRPVVISYDTTQGDSVFMRGDSILMLSYLWSEGPAAEAATGAADKDAAAMAELMGGVNTPVEIVENEPIADKVNAEIDDKVNNDSEIVNDNLETEEELQESPEAVQETEESEEAANEPTSRELKALAREAAFAEKMRAREVREYRKLQGRWTKAEQRMEERRAKGRSIFTDSLTVERLALEMQSTAFYIDSVGQADSAVVDTVTTDSMAVLQVDSLGAQEDSLYRIVNIYRSAEIYRSDFQVAADSIVAISRDTSMQAHISPVVWSGAHQISSDEMFIYTLDGNLDYAEFFGKPVMSSQVVPNDTTYFNQVTGKEMVAFFENNNVYRNDVNSNVETIYFLQDEQSGEVNTISRVESGSASFFIENQQLDGVIYRSQPSYVFAPLEKRPADLSMTLKNFEWFGSRRPTREEIFDREIRPSRREEMTTRSAELKPTFPISERIARSRRSLTNSGEWSDRDDRVSAEATRWMKSLGFTPGEPRKQGEGGFGF